MTQGQQNGRLCTVPKKSTKTRTHQGYGVAGDGQQVVHDEQEHGVAQNERHLEQGAVDALRRQEEAEQVHGDQETAGQEEVHHVHGGTALHGYLQVGHSVSEQTVVSVDLSCALLPTLLVHLESLFPLCYHRVI